MRVRLLRQLLLIDTVTRMRAQSSVAESDVHPELRDLARRIPMWLPGPGPRTLRLIRSLAGRMKVEPVGGVRLIETEYGDLHLPEGVDPTQPHPTRPDTTRPETTRPETTQRGAILWIHGGGLVLGAPRQDAVLASLLAARVGVPVLAVRYRLAPEHPYPAGLDDCMAALAWLSAHELVDPTRVIVAGASAGGGLAAAVAQRAHAEGHIRLAGQVLIYPMLDDRTGSTNPVSGKHRVWSQASNRFGWSSYLACRAGSSDVAAPAAPARATDLSGLPAAYVAVGDLDLFHDESVEYAARLTAAGVDCELTVVAGAFHAFDRFAPHQPVSREWLAGQIRWMRERLGA